MLLPDVCLVRRQDEVSVIGAAIAASVAGEGYRRIAGRLGVPADTVRGWLRRFGERAELIRSQFTRCAVALDPELGPVMPAGSRVADAVEVIAVAGRAWVLRFGPGDPWRAASRLSGGWLFVPNYGHHITGGHFFSPLVATNLPAIMAGARWWPRISPARRGRFWLVQGLDPLAGGCLREPVADGPVADQDVRAARAGRRSTVAIVLGISSSKPDGWMCELIAIDRFS